MIEPRKSIACCDRLDEFAGSRDAPSFLKDNRLLDKVPLKKPGLLRVCSMTALVGLIERIEEPHSQALKVVHIASD
jgi:hypothetical protein